MEFVWKEDSTLQYVELLKLSHSVFFIWFVILHNIRLFIKGYTPIVNAFKWIFQYEVCIWINNKVRKLAKAKKRSRPNLRREQDEWHTYGVIFKWLHTTQQKQNKIETSST